jgi:hypothetical protein
MNLIEFISFSCGTLSFLVSSRKTAEKNAKILSTSEKTYFSKCRSGNIKVYASICSLCSLVFAANNSLPL